MIKIILICTLAAVVITVGVNTIILHSQGKGDETSKIQTIGLPERGLLLIGPKHPTFYNLRTLNTDTSTGNPFSVFVVNTSAQSVAAFITKWEILLPDGKISTHVKGQRGALETVSDGQSLHLTTMIAPGGNKPISLIDSPNSSGRQFRTGGGPDIARQLSDSVKVTVSIDGVLFGDGTFVGPDSKNYFTQLKAEIDAKRDLFTEIFHLMDSGVESEAIMSHLETVAKGQFDNAQRQIDSARRPSAEAPRYSFWNSLQKKGYANILLKMRKARGDEAVSEFIRAESSKPQIKLRKR